MRTPRRDEPRGQAGFGEATTVRQTSDKYSTDPNSIASRRHFLVVALMSGWLRPERVAKSIAKEIERETMP